MFGSLITHHQIEHDCHQLQCLQSVLISGLRSIIRCDPSEVRRIHSERSQAEAVMVVLGYCPHLGSTEEPRLLYFGGRLRGPFTAYSWQSRPAAWNQQHGRCCLCVNRQCFARCVSVCGAGHSHPLLAPQRRMNQSLKAKLCSTATD